MHVGERVTVAEISETAKRMEMSMMGLARGTSRSGSAAMGHILAPPADLEVEIREGDRIIAVADLI